MWQQPAVPARFASFFIFLDFFNKKKRFASSYSTVVQVVSESSV